MSQVCPVCQGTRTFLRDACYRCNGKGKINNPRKPKVIEVPSDTGETMGQVRRFGVTTVEPGDDRLPYGMMIEDPMGEYVRYVDFLKLQIHIEQLQKATVAKSFRWKHVPTGLFYIPSRDVRATVKNAAGKEIWVYTKSNLSKTGKIYGKNIAAPTGIYNHLAYIEQAKKSHSENSYAMARPCFQQTIESDWVKVPA